MNLKKIRILNFAFIVFLSFFFYARNANAYTAYEDKYIACKKDGTWQCVVQKNKGVLTCDGAAMDTYNECLTNVKAIVAAEPKWYMCHTTVQMIWTCKSSFVPGCLNSPIFSSLDNCQKKIAADGGTYSDTEVYSPDAAKAQAAAKAKAEQDAKAAQEQAQADQAEKAKQAAAKKAQADDAAAAAIMVCDCSKNGGQCKDSFTSVQEAGDYCNSCGLPAPAQNSNPSSPGCPLGSKEIGPFHCSCGSGDKAVCSNYDTFSELDAKCAQSCGRGNNTCPSDTSDVLKKLQKEAKILNPAGFAFGSAGVTEIIGKIITFLLFPIGMFAMALYIWAGFLWMTAQGNSENVTKAKSVIVWTTLGIVITLASYLIVQLVFTQIL